MAITGPFVTEIGGMDYPCPFYRRQEKWKSRPRVPLPYHMVQKRTLAVSGDITAHARDARFSYVDDNAYTIQLVSNVAYERLLSQLRENASLGTTLAEFGQTSRMVVDRIHQLTRFTKAIRRWDLPQAFSELERSGVKSQSYYRPRNTSRFRSASNNWLEYHFGWSPLIGDIYSGIKALEAPINSTAIKASATGYNSESERRGAFSPNFAWKVKTRVAHGCEVKVTNPNLALASQLGLVNPASIAWELVPFSFVIDWFSNVGQVIASHTDWVGLETQREFYVIHEDGLESEFWNNYGWTHLTHLLRTRRGTGIVTPVVAIKPFKGFSATRGATAIALLIQAMKSLK